MGAARLLGFVCLRTRAAARMNGRLLIIVLCRAPAPARTRRRGLLCLVIRGARAARPGGGAGTARAAARCRRLVGVSGFRGFLLVAARRKRLGRLAGFDCGAWFLEQRHAVVHFELHLGARLAGASHPTASATAACGGGIVGGVGGIGIVELGRTQAVLGQIGHMFLVRRAATASRIMASHGVTPPSHGSRASRPWKHPKVKWSRADTSVRGT